jgi:two-component system LytT family sensor kinase
MQPVTNLRDPLILRLLLQLIRPETVQVNIHRWVATSMAFLFAYLLWGHAYFSSWAMFLGISIFMQASASLSTVIVAGLTGWTYRRYPEPEQARRRLTLNSIGLVLMGISLTSGGLWLFDAVHLFGFRYNPRLGPWIVVLSVVLDLLLVGFFEIAFAFRQWENKQLETKQLEQQQLQRQLTEIKQKVNPHFLFNSLNSLSVLISEDPARAEQFVDELAKVYRYQLQAYRNSQLPATESLVPIEAELRHLQTYAHLLRTRYGTGLELRIAPSTWPGGALLPLTLQLLVDHAIQHNSITPARPLRIDIQPASGHVRVQHTRHARSTRIPTGPDTLVALQERYQLLGPAHALTITEDATHCNVLVPLK